MTYTQITSTRARAASEDLGTHIDPARVLTGGLDYEKAIEVWNGAVHHRPAVVVLCESVPDVQAVVRAARTHQLPLSVRGGGHDWAGRALREDGLVVDLTRMREVTVTGTKATAQGGATSLDVLTAAGQHGLAAVTGSIGSVGITGLTLGGGYGPLAGVAGLATDNLLGADVVLADGRAVHTDATHEPELFWALHGGGGNFGVVTSLTLRLHHLDTILTGAIAFPWDQAGTVLAGLAEVLRTAPDGLTAQTGILSTPDGKPAVFVLPAWTGDPDAGAAAIATITALGTPLMAQVAPMSVAAMIAGNDALMQDGLAYIIRSRNLDGLTPTSIASLISAGTNRTSPASMISIHHFHGAATRVPPTDTAFGLRRDHLMVEVIAAWQPSDDDTAHRAWADDLDTALAPDALPGGYPNLIGPDATDQAARAYGPNTTRLLATKTHFDPDGVFTATALPSPTA